MSLIKIVILVLAATVACDSNNLFDDNLYENELDAELCAEQLQILNDTGIVYQFYDASARVPRGISTGNLADWGSYHHCFKISHGVADGTFANFLPSIQGKYCSIDVPLLQSTELSVLPYWNDKRTIEYDERTLNDIRAAQEFKQQMMVLLNLSNGTSRAGPGSPVSLLSVNLGVCIPRACTTQEFFDYFVFIERQLEYTDDFCRLPKDKPFAAVDYIAIIFFVTIGLLLISSTIYDVQNTVFHKTEPHKINKIYTSFSVYTNTKRLLKNHNSDDAIHCVDGIRVISMLWVIVGHNFTTLSPVVSNKLDAIDWMTSMESIWLVTSPIVVDTFFMMSGLLLVYTSVRKLSRSKFLRSLHLFYFLRYLRLFPLLLGALFFQASLAHRLSDGPNWTHSVALEVERCRKYWWSTLLYIQNYINPNDVCILQSWYLSVDMQLYWISPLILVWVIGGSRRVAWSALSSALCISLTIAGIICFYGNFQSSLVNPSRLREVPDYMKYYYMNTLTRASPFFVGMIYGYVMYLCRGKKIIISDKMAAFYWILSIGSSAFVIFIMNPVSQSDHNIQFLDNFLNTFMRPIWAGALGWCIFACAHGYGGPINRFLSHSFWKLPAKLSFAMYLYHYTIIMISVGSLVNPPYFTVPYIMYRFIAELFLTCIVSFVAVLAFDSPVSALLKIALSRGAKPREPLPVKNEDHTNIIFDEPTFKTDIDINTKM